MNTNRDVLCIGNAIVDVIASADEAFLGRHGLVRGTMHLVDAATAAQLETEMADDRQVVPGGSAANTAAGVASLGGCATFVGKVADDALGAAFADGMRDGGTAFSTPPLSGGEPTGRSLILVTPDGERTMSTFLGASHNLAEADIAEADIAAAKIVFLEGFLWDPPNAKEAFLKAARLARANGRTAALTLSDVFCVDRFRAEFLDLIRSRTIDLVLANEAEVKSLYETSDFETAVAALKSDCGSAAVTMGEKGALGWDGGEIVRVPAKSVDRVLDTTGAGDQFAAGFLLALARGRDIPSALQLGCLCASEVIAHIGARPAMSLKQLAEKHGLAV